jgi:hypothetical protein
LKRFINLSRTVPAVLDYFSVDRRASGAEFRCDSQDTRLLVPLVGVLRSHNLVEKLCKNRWLGV